VLVVGGMGGRVIHIYEETHIHRSVCMWYAHRSGWIQWGGVGWEGVYTYIKRKKHIGLPVCGTNFSVGLFSSMPLCECEMC